MDPFQFSFRLVDQEMDQIKPDYRCLPPTLIAIINGDLKELNSIKNADNEINIIIQEPITNLMASNGKLITATPGWSSLHVAVVLSHHDIADYLIKSGADVNYLADHSPMYLALAFNSFLIAKMLYDIGACMNEKEIDHSNEVERIWLNGCLSWDVKYFESMARMNLGRYIQDERHPYLTSLHLATIKGDHQAMHFLLRNGVDVNRKCNHEIGSTQVMSTAEIKGYQVFDFASGSNMIPIASLTALHFAAIRDDYKGIEILVSKGADLQAKCSNFMWTPLQYAKQLCNTSAEVVLVKLNAGVGHFNLFLSTYTRVQVDLDTNLCKRKQLNEMDSLPMDQFEFKRKRDF